MSTSRALCCLPLVKKQKRDFNFFRSMYNKTIIRFGFCDIQNNRGLGKGYQPQPSASADNPYLVLDYSGYHKNLIQKLFIITISINHSEPENSTMHFFVEINKRELVSSA